ncbi:MAG: triose-phosphate isomerase, partial [Methylocystaceae bacterium]
WLDMVAQGRPPGVDIGAQNLCSQTKGAFTGEISAAMLLDVGCRYVIIGHSERRQLMGENDQVVHEKTKQALLSGLLPLICVGESERQRQSGQAKETVLAQLQGALAGMDFKPGQLVIAYEPVWAIGTGNTASTADAQEMAAFIRYCLRDMMGDELASQTQILYGGSVTPDNAADLLSEPDVDGALVGGASLDPVKFCAIVASGRSQ